MQQTPQTEKSYHTSAHNQSNQISQLSNCDLLFSGFVGQGLLLPTLFFGCFLSVRSGYLEGCVCFGECSLENVILQLLKVFWNPGEQGLCFFCCFFLYIFMIKNINNSNKSSFPWMKPTWRTVLYLDIFSVLQVL